MANREVRAVTLDPSGRVVALVNLDAPWRQVSAEDAIRDIDAGRHKYFVQWPEKRTVVMSVHGVDGKYLRTNRDYSPTKHLATLPHIERSPPVPENISQAG